MSLRQKTISGVTWSAIDSLANQGIHFIVGIVMARVILPREFGLIGMTAIFMAISQSFINSGFSSALIRKNDSTQTDHSTVFYYNLAMGLLFYAILFLSAGIIARFFDEPLLKPIIRVLGLDLIIRSLTIIQTTILVKRVDFKLQAIISVIAGVLSGVIGIVMAYQGYGVWSLVARMMTLAFVNSLLLWWWNRWRPSWVFSRTSFRELFGFGSKLLLSGLIDTIYRNIYYVVIGKYFSAKDLGYFTRAKMFNDLPSHQITSVMSRVTYPVLSQMRGNPVMLKGGYRRMITGTTFISFTMMAGMAAVAEPMVITLIGEPWRPSIIYLQMLCFAGMMYPLHALNLNMLQVQGRSDLFLRLEIIKKLLAVPTIVIGVIWGIKVMIAGMMVNTVIAYYLNSYWSGKMVNYPMREQLRDIQPSFLLALSMAVVVYFTGLYLPLGYSGKLLVQVILGAVLVFVVSELFRISPYLYLKEIALSRFNALRNARK